MEEKPNIRHEVVFMAPVAQGEELPALHDEPEDVVERLETFHDGVLVLIAGNHVGTVTHTG